MGKKLHEGRSRMLVAVLVAYLVLSVVPWLMGRAFRVLMAGEVGMMVVWVLMVLRVGVFVVSGYVLWVVGRRVVGIGREEVSVEGSVALVVLVIVSLLVALYWGVGRASGDLPADMVWVLWKWG